MDLNEVEKRTTTNSLENLVHLGNFLTRLATASAEGLGGNCWNATDCNLLLLSGQGMQKCKPNLRRLLIHPKATEA